MKVDPWVVARVALWAVGKAEKKADWWVVWRVGLKGGWWAEQKAALLADKMAD